MQLWKGKGLQLKLQGVTTANPAPCSNNLDWRASAHFQHTNSSDFPAKNIQPPQINAVFLGSAVKGSIEGEENKITGDVIWSAKTHKQE